MKLDSHDGEKNDEQNGVGFVEIPKTVMTRNSFCSLKRNHFVKYMI